MKITAIRVENYRSIELVEIEPNAFNVVVGQNNHGKTNFFEAMNWFFVGAKKDELPNICREKNLANKPQVRITFSGAQAGAELMHHAANKTKIKSALGGSDIVTIQRFYDEKRTFEVNGQVVDTGTGFDTALNDFLPKLEYISARKFFDDVGKFGKTTPVGVMLSGVLETILETDQGYRAFQAKFEELFQDPGSPVRIEIDNLGGRVQVYLQKQFPDCSSVKFRVGQPLFEDLLKNFETMVDDGVETDVSEKGDGMQRALMLAIIRAYADFRQQNEDVGKSFLFLIDEAELHLHPTAQRALKSALIELTERGDQVLINTHSSVLVAEDNAVQNIYVARKEMRKTSVLLVDQPVDKQQVVYELLGGSPADLLLPHNFLIVEGQSEYHFIKKIISRFYIGMKPIQIVFASGDQLQQHRSFDAINKVYSPLWLTPVYRDKAIILCDAPSTTIQQGQLAQFKTSYPDLEVDPVQLFVLPVSNLEEYYPAPWKKTLAEIGAMNGNNDKVNLAKECAEGITQSQFEQEMVVIFRALTQCVDQAY